MVESSGSGAEISCAQNRLIRLRTNTGLPFYSFIYILIRHYKEMQSIVIIISFEREKIIQKGERVDSKYQ